MFFAVIAVIAAIPTPDAKAEAKPDAKPLVVAAPIAYSAPLVSAPFVTATSSQAIVRNYNGYAVSAPLVASSPYVASSAAYAAYSGAYSPYFAQPAAYNYVASPYTVAAGVPVVV